MFANFCFLHGRGPANSTRKGATIGENGAEIDKNVVKMGPRRAKEGEVSPRWPRMAEARLLEAILVSFAGFWGRFEAEVVTVLVICSTIFSFLFLVAVLEAIDLDFEARFGDFCEPEGARETQTCFNEKSSFPSVKVMFSRVGGLPRSSK